MIKTPERTADVSQSKVEFRFDVAHDGWIGVVDENGETKHIGLIELLCDAHKWHAVRDELPPVECGLLRLLVAFALDIFGPRDGDDWKDIWKAKQFDEAKVRAYFEKHAARMNLFDSSQPFLQDGDVGGDDKPLAGLLASQPAGTNAAHFHHGDEEDFAVSPATAARLLSLISPFMTAGGAGLSPSINGAPPWYVLLRGEDLFQTIWLNCPVGDIVPQSDNDCPAWRDTRAMSKQDRTECGLLEAFTWRPRRIRLVPQTAPNGLARCELSGEETPVLVAHMKFAAGWSTRFDGFEWRDPHVPYRISKDGKMVLRPRESRDVWRDVGALALADGDGAERPGIVRQFAALMQHRHLGKNTPLRFTVYGMRSDMKMKIFEWHRETLSLPAPLVLQRGFANIAQTEMKLADDVARRLRYAIKRTYDRRDEDDDERPSKDEGEAKKKFQDKGNDKAFDSLIARAQSAFWHRLRRAYIGEENSLLRSIANVNPEDQTALNERVAVWRKELRKVALASLDGAIGDLRGAVSGLDADGGAIMRQVKAHRYFHGQLWALFNPEEAMKKKKEKAND